MPQTKQELEAEIATLEQMLQENATRLRNCMAAEDPAKGIYFASDIHALRQEKLVLTTRKDLRHVRIRRILYAGNDIT